MTSLNILYIHRTRGHGVERVHIEGMAESWRKMGHAVRYFSPDGISERIKESTDAGEGLLGRIYGGISKFAPELLFELLEIGYGIMARKRLKEFLDNNRIDLVYERYAFFSHFGLDMAIRKHIPFILEVNYTVHDPLVRKRSKWLSPLCYRTEKRLLQSADGLLAVSSFLKNQIMDRYGVNGEKILMVPNAADPEKFFLNESPEALKQRFGFPKCRIIGFVGGFYPWHEVRLLIESFHGLLREFPQIMLLLLGDGPERNSLEQLVGEMGIAEKVVFAGAVPHERLNDYIGCFDIAVMPNSNEYGSPMKIFEYMALSKPLVVPDYGPLTDVVTHNIEGLVFKKGNVAALTEAVRTLLSDQDLSDRIGKNGRRLIETTHNWKRNSERVLEYLSTQGRLRDQK